VRIREYQQPALTGRDPAIDSMSPFQGCNGRLPLSTGRCPVLLMTGLSALLPPGVEAVSKALFRHCELLGMKQETIHKSLLMNRIASIFDLAMTVKRAFDTPSTGRGTPRFYQKQKILINK
jgi:hypothetical protein